MNVSEQPFCDHDDPDEKGLHSYWHEGTNWIFDFGEGRSVQARRYSDAPATASLLFSSDGPVEGDAELDDVVAWLRNAGIVEITVLGGPSGTYRPLQHPG